MLYLLILAILSAYMNLDSKLKCLRKELDALYQIESCMAVLGYDQQVLMPPGAASGRAKQLEFLSALHHQHLSADSLWDLTSDLFARSGELDEDHRVIVRELHRHLTRSRKLSVEFVAEKSKVAAESFSVWCQARPANDWESVRPYLEKIIQLNREEAQLVGYEKHPYDALLDSFEPYATLDFVKPLLLSVADRIKTVLPELCKKFGSPKSLFDDPASPANQAKLYPVDKQQELCRRVMNDLGFDFKHGRLDTAAHPFMSTLGSQDIRITTRYNPSSFLPALFGTIHETGHAFYESGLPVQFRGTARGAAVSMGIHESQSRLWENMVGRSQAFCDYLATILPEYFGFEISASSLWANANHIERSLIRVEADEVSYTLHIVIRMLLEERLISGDLQVADAPQAWNELYKEYLGLEVPDLSNGIMQDVHWFGGSIGYFPSYALGNLYGAMFIETFEREKGSLKSIIENRSFSTLKDWLTEKIYSCGQKFPAGELVKQVTGKPLSSEAFLSYLSGKLGIGI